MQLVLGARQSDLARLQAYLVGAALEQQGCEIKYAFRESLGDKNLTDPLWKMPEKGVFTQDFYQDLVSGKLDFVVHSWKDLPVESTPDTEIVATMPRADQRDLLLLKKTSLNKTNLKIFSSSPRREYNLIPFLRKHLPWQTENIQFGSVRGNIPTRIQKLIDDNETDGLVLAKAAIDRLLSHPAEEFSQMKHNVSRNIQLCQWMVFPLSENPNAPAQGALAIEIRKDRQDLKQLFAKIHCQKTSQSVVHERKIFSQYGGGCHQKIGVSVESKSYGEILTVKGLSPKGEVLNQRELISSQIVPKNLVRKSLEFIITRQQNNNITANDLNSLDAVWVSRAQAGGEFLKNYSGVVWAAGVKTWEQLAAMGIWVQGCAEGLGEQEDPRLSVLMQASKSKSMLNTNEQTQIKNSSIEQTQAVNWGLLTHDKNVGEDFAAETVSSFGSDASSSLISKKYFSAYQLDVQLDLATADLSSDILQNEKYFFYWKSYSQFQAACKAVPGIKKQFHACGPGKTWHLIAQDLQKEDLNNLNTNKIELNKSNVQNDSKKLFIYLSEEDWRNEAL